MFITKHETFDWKFILTLFKSPSSIKQFLFPCIFYFFFNLSKTFLITVSSFGCLYTYFTFPWDMSLHNIHRLLGTYYVYCFFLFFHFFFASNKSMRIQMFRWSTFNAVENPLRHLLAKLSVPRIFSLRAANNNLIHPTTTTLLNKSLRFDVFYFFFSKFDTAFWKSSRSEKISKIHITNVSRTIRESYPLAHEVFYFVSSNFFNDFLFVRVTHRCHDNYIREPHRGFFFCE